MRFRKLRIAWSVLWGFAAVLLVVLWVRSYQATDVCMARPFCISAYGRVVIWVRENNVAHGGSGLQPIDLSSASLLWASQVEGPEPFEVEPFRSRTGFYLLHDYWHTVVQIPYWFVTSAF